MKPVMYIFAHSRNQFEEFKKIFEKEDILIKRVYNAMDLREISPGNRLVKLPFDHNSGINRDAKVEKAITHYCLHSRISIYNITGTKYERLLEEAKQGNADASHSFLDCAND